MWRDTSGGCALKSAKSFARSSYDGLNRLRTATVKVGVTSPVTVLDLTYDALGNICSKNGAAYTYAGRDGCNATGTSATASPHAVTQIGSQTFVYGANGRAGTRLRQRRRARALVRV